MNDSFWAGFEKVSNIFTSTVNKTISAKAFRNKIKGLTGKTPPSTPAQAGKGIGKGISGTGSDYSQSFKETMKAQPAARKAEYAAEGIGPKP